LKKAQKKFSEVTASSVKPSELESSTISAYKKRYFLILLVKIGRLMGE
jgi:hypothetical protein